MPMFDEVETLHEEEPEEESRIARIGKENRRKRKEAETRRMKKSGRSLFTILETQKRRADRLRSPSSDEEPHKIPFKKSRRGRR